MQRTDSLAKTLMLERLKAGGEGDHRGWDGWMASPMQWTWVWVGSESWWWTGMPGMLQSIGSQRGKHNWVTELNWYTYRYTQTIIHTHTHTHTHTSFYWFYNSGEPWLTHLSPIRLFTFEWSKSEISEWVKYYEFLLYIEKVYDRIDRKKTGIMLWVRKILRHNNFGKRKYES